MRFDFTEEQEQFREFVRRFLTDTSPTTEVRRVMETAEGFDADVWHRLSRELSLPGLCIPEAYGGAGFGMVELGIAMEEMGRALYCSPFFASSVLAAKALETLASESEKIELLPGIAAGDTIATLALLEASGIPDLARLATTATRTDVGYLLNGSKKFVVDGCIADLVLVVATTDDGLSLFRVAPDARGFDRVPLSVLDPTRKLATMQFNDTPATLLGEPGQAVPGLQRTLDMAFIALANESVGGATRLLEDTLEYIKLRRQFGRTIASFQAVKHRMAEFLLVVELARSAACFAAASVDETTDPDVDEVPMLASLASASAAEAFAHAGTEAIQLHGGVGFTWENDTHLWFKRARSSAVFLGDSNWHRARMVAELVKEQAA